MREDSFHLGVKAIMRNKEGKVLLLEKESRSKKQTFWDLPGGRINRGETVLEALQRELEEEVALQELPPVTYVGMHLTQVRIPQEDSDVGLILSLYVVDSLLDFTPLLSAEHSNFAWFNQTEVVAYLLSRYPAELVSNIEKFI